MKGICAATFDSSSGSGSGSGSGASPVWQSYTQYTDASCATPLLRQGAPTSAPLTATAVSPIACPSSGSSGFRAVSATSASAPTSASVALESGIVIFNYGASPSCAAPTSFTAVPANTCLGLTASSSYKVAACSTATGVVTLANYGSSPTCGGAASVSTVQAGASQSCIADPGGGSSNYMKIRCVATFDSTAAVTVCAPAGAATFTLKDPAATYAPSAVFVPLTRCAAMLRASMGALVASEQPDVLTCVGSLVAAGLADATKLIPVGNCDLRNWRPQLRALRGAVDLLAELPPAEGAPEEEASVVDETLSADQTPLQPLAQAFPAAEVPA